MGSIVVKQPDGKLAVWSTVVDDFVVVDSTPEEIATHYAELAAEDARERWLGMCARAEADGTSSRRDGYRWPDLLAERDERHGPDPDRFPPSQPVTPHHLPTSGG